MPRPGPLAEPRKARLVYIDEHHGAGQFLVAGKRTDGCEDIEAGIPRAAVDLAKVGDGGGEADKGQAQGQQCQGKAAPEPSRHRGDHRMASPAEKIGRYSATTMTPIIRPTKTIIKGSMMVDRPSTTAVNSSS